MSGYMPCVAAKYAAYYASYHSRLNTQASVRSINAQFNKSLFPSRGPVRVFLREISVGKAWSTLRAAVFQPVNCHDTAVSVDMLYVSLPWFLQIKLRLILSISNRSVSSLTLPTNWMMHPPPRPVDLDKLETDSNPGWICYHTAFKPNGFKRAHSYLKHFIPLDWKPETPFNEQWIKPGGDCMHAGSSVHNSYDTTTEGETQPRWTTDMIPLIMDASLSPECNFLRSKNGEGEHQGSMAAFLRYAHAQKKARERGEQNWRDLPNDGSEKFDGSLLYVTLAMSADIRQELPVEGVWWLYLRNEVKSIRNGGINVETLLFDEMMRLVAVSHQVGQLVSSGRKGIKADSRL